MQVLGIDYGNAKVGLAVGSGFLAEPLKVIRYKDLNNLINQIGEVIKKENISKVIVGVSESEMGTQSKAFGELLKDKFAMDVDFQDETLSTHEAQELSRASGIKRIKRKGLEDAYAASIMLQNYLDSKKT